MRQLQVALWLRRSLAGARALCSCSAADGELLAGSVKSYDQHVLIQLPRVGAADAAAAATAAATAAAPGQQACGSHWSELVEREPAVLSAFKAAAQYRDILGGTLKITAFDDVDGSSAGPPPRSCNLLAFPAGLRFDGLPEAQVGLAVALAAADNPNQSPLRASERKALQALQVPVPPLTLLVCCHAARDARCGELGPPLARALQRLVQQRGLGEQVQVLATSHIGGHKYAGNLIVYGAMHPCDGDWFGGIDAGHAAAFLDALVGIELGVDGGAEDPALRPFWRGRMGLSREEQQELFEQGGAIEDLAEAPSEDEDDEGRAELEAAMRQRAAGRRQPQ